MSVQEREVPEQLPAAAEVMADWRDPARRTAVRERRAGRLVWRWWGRRFINVFIVFHLFALAVWLPSNPSALQQTLIPIVRPYLTFTGMMQAWLMFSPSPDRCDIYYDAQITYASGARQTWTFPRMAKMGYVQRYREERFRKLVEVSRASEYRFLWPSLARYAARQANTRRGDPPIHVDLISHYRFIPPPGVSIPDYQDQIFYSQALTPNDLASEDTK